MTTPMILVPTNTIETTQLDKQLSELDSAMGEILKEDLDESVKAKKYLLMLQKFLRYSSARESIRSRPVPVVSMNKPEPVIKPLKRKRNAHPTTRPITASTWVEEEEMDVPEYVNESPKKIKSVRKKRTSVKKINKILSPSPVRTRLWNAYYNKRVNK